MALSVGEIAPTFEATCLVILSAFASVVAIYTLLVFARNRFNSSRKHFGSSNLLPAKTCQTCGQSNLNCKIIYNKPTTTRANGAACARCGGALESQVSTTSNILRQQQNTFDSYGQPSHQHPIIFGKSKDSILVPELVADLALDSGGGAIGGGGGGGGSGGDYDLPPATTRVLTDEKGHSIKIRIASPPPQRQSQLAAAAAAADERDRKSSQATTSSDDAWKSPEVPRKGNGSNNNQRARQRPQSSMALFSQLRLDDGDGSGGGGGGSAAQVSDIQRPNEEQEQEQEQHWAGNGMRPTTEAGGSAVNLNGLLQGEQAEALRAQDLGDNERRIGQQAPIEAFNDSNTSEFDDAAAWDSRQDTSLDFGAANSNNGSQQGSASDQVNSWPTRVGHDEAEAVMDNDLRQANRLNLELMVLQNTAQQAIGGQQLLQQPASVLAAISQARSARSRSLGGAAGAFSQSGFLPPASTGDHHQHRRDSGAGRKWRLTGSSADEHDSGIAGEGSRRSSEQLASSFGHSPSLRLSIRLLKAEANEEPKRSLLTTLASIGRTRSSEPDEQLGQRAHAEQLVEVRLIEARNIMRKNTNSSGANQATGATTGTAFDPDTTGRARSRRESLLGALVAAATSAPQRRHSAESVFARVFKNQAANEARVGANVGRRARSERAESAGAEQAAVDGCGQQQHYDSLSLHSNSSLPASADYLQLAPVKLVAGATHETCSPPPPSWLNFSDVTREPYGFVCRLSEFPIRISLYQVGKRGARYTLGHCFVGPNDWPGGSNSPAPDNRKRLSSDSAASSSSHSGADSHQVESFVRLSAAPGSSSGARNSSADSRETMQDASGENDDENEGTHLLEYKLHQTILEAISSRQL